MMPSDTPTFVISTNLERDLERGKDLELMDEATAVVNAKFIADDLGVSCRIYRLVEHAYYEKKRINEHY